MSLLRPTNEFARGSGVSPVAPAAGGWITISNGDLTAVQGSYTGFALSASPTAFENRIAIRHLTVGLTLRDLLLLVHLLATMHRPQRESVYLVVLP